MTVFPFENLYHTTMSFHACFQACAVNCCSLGICDTQYCMVVLSLSISIKIGLHRQDPSCGWELQRKSYSLYTIDWYLIIIGPFVIFLFYLSSHNVGQLDSCGSMDRTVSTSIDPPKNEIFNSQFHYDLFDLIKQWGDKFKDFVMDVSGNVNLYTTMIEKIVISTNGMSLV